MTRRANWNPYGFPSPSELGYSKGTRVVQVQGGLAYTGTVTRVTKHSIEWSSDSYATLMQCHPCIGISVLDIATLTLEQCQLTRAMNARVEEIRNKAAEERVEAIRNNAAYARLVEISVADSLPT